MKPAARLTSTLLARKGYALPSGALSPVPYDLDSSPSESQLKAPGHGHFILTAPPAGEKIAAVKGVARKLESPAGKATKPGKKSRDCLKFCENSQASDDDHAIVAMTLRLEEKQHKRLRLISVHCHKSAREIMTTALDIYLSKLEKELDITACECLKQSRPNELASGERPRQN
jgi:hypothetical protein